MAARRSHAGAVDAMRHLLAGAACMVVVAWIGLGIALSRAPTIPGEQPGGPGLLDELDQAAHGGVARANRAEAAPGDSGRRIPPPPSAPPPTGQVHRPDQARRPAPPERPDPWALVNAHPRHFRDPHWRS
jgi:hypothetical protein